MSSATETDFVIDAAPVIPVVVLEDASKVHDLATALVAGGLPCIEITLRTPAAMDALAAVAGVEGAIPGVGTVTTPAQMEAAKARGARFAVSPGHTATLLDTADALGLPYLPGAATPAEMQALMERGYRNLKFFPAEASGGAAYLKNFAGVFKGLRFCPTGGVSPGNMADYLSLPNCDVVGGSWVVPATAVEAGDWDQLTELARTAISKATSINR
ncbi:MAG: bifunctional 4-hydroxy-2-oxoglutarate aldolase/2-dehydro-3-deoxy-phosphogluconate aldolase [Pseudomonadota bacterium]|nr:bifunctional 4-hydroxy-2-oxoglutarate aldolase/2-dehydro-3-deoxy-phosphogluconate aldolase [Pseudomonadota bacterium]MEC8710632.1 bifunctional 4-hydroxy-2-oxoglutarate aldolase/2-dehydro-3-deoxy-phosphogluconate aldolase [Pseudomonadota bacterium]